MKHLLWTGALFALSALATGCSSSANGPGSTSGGTGGGAPATGGTATSPPATGGSEPSGGRSGSGGLSGPGGSTSAQGGNSNAGGAAIGSGGTNARGGTPGLGGGTNPTGGGGGATSNGEATGGSVGSGGTVGLGGAASGTGGRAGLGGTSSTGGLANNGGATTRTGGATGTGGTVGTGGIDGKGGSTGSSCSGPIGTLTGALADGIAFMDDQGKRVNAHGGGIIKEGDTYYMHGEYFLSTTTDNDFNGFSMYSSKDLATWKFEKIILPQQPNGDLGPKRKGERPHIIKCPSTGKFVLYAHAADETYQADKEIVYATSDTVNGDYTLQGRLANSSGTIAAHSDMSALTDGNSAYVITESGHVYTLAANCQSWLTDNSYSAVNGDSGGSESPTVFKAGSTYYWIGSYKTGWRANNNFYSTAPAMTGPWTYQGFIAPVTDTGKVVPDGGPNSPEQISDQRTWLSQSTWVTPVVGCNGTVYVYWGDHWYGNQDTSNPGKHNDQATYVFQPLVFTGTNISMPEYHSTWKLDVGAGTLVQ